MEGYVIDEKSLDGLEKTVGFLPKAATTLAGTALVYAIVSASPVYAQEPLKTPTNPAQSITCEEPGASITYFDLETGEVYGTAKDLKPGGPPQTIYFPLKPTQASKSKSAPLNSVELKTKISELEAQLEQKPNDEKLVRELYWTYMINNQNLDAKKLKEEFKSSQK
ncbi:hypothetical protein GOV04_00635 [Candidatus Woesearchaeota archaeon]|nr:hypothetical protein [Candidatus Woesearchaeota archaeon]